MRPLNEYRRDVLRATSLFPLEQGVTTKQRQQVVHTFGIRTKEAGKQPDSRGQ